MKVYPEARNLFNTYHGKTQYQCYCSFINSILSNLRSGGVDYCFYIYQISELLKYEHDRLQADWLQDEKCFELRLNKEYCENA